jgi:hypothetical protein
MNKVCTKLSYDPWDEAYVNVQVAFMHERASYENVFENTHREVSDVIDTILARINEASHGDD